MLDFKFEETDTETVLTVNGELTIQNAAALQEILIKSLETAEHLIIHPENIEDVDLTFFQMICSVHRASAGQNKQVTLSDRCASVFRKAVRDAGFSGDADCAFAADQKCLWKEMNEHTDKGAD